jgi:hypothetical protein
MVTPESRIVLMLDEDDAGRVARAKIVPRLTAHCYVRYFRFGEEDQQPDALSAEQLTELTR